MGPVQGQSIDKKTSTEFLPTKTLLSFGRHEKVGHINMHQWGLVYTCTRVFARESSTIVNSPFWNIRMYWFNSFKLITGLLAQSFFSLWIYCLQISLFVDKLVLQHFSSRGFPLLMRLLSSLAWKVYFLWFPF